MNTLALLQVADSPAWVGPTMAISLVVIAVMLVGAAIAVIVAALRVASQVKRVTDVVEGLQGDAAQTLAAARKLTEQGQDLIVLVRHEAGAFSQTARRVRRKLTRGADELEAKLTDLETLYEVVYDEIEETALDVTSALRSARKGNGVLGRVRRLLVPGR